MPDAAAACNAQAICIPVYKLITFFRRWVDQSASRLPIDEKIRTPCLNKVQACCGNATFLHVRPRTMLRYCNMAQFSGCVPPGLTAGGNCELAGVLYRKRHRWGRQSPFAASVDNHLTYLL